jgi:hypothetical protein
MNILSSNFLSNNKNVTIYRNIILPVVLYGCETWSLTLKEERRHLLFENKVLRRIFGPKRNEAKESGEDYVTKSLMICTPHQIFSG